MLGKKLNTVLRRIAQRFKKTYGNQNWQVMRRTAKKMADLDQPLAAGWLELLRFLITKTFKKSR
jgi:hypothetical protein